MLVGFRDATMEIYQNSQASVGNVNVQAALYQFVGTDEVEAKG